jgi:hypothetical protein
MANENPRAAAMPRVIEHLVDLSATAYATPAVRLGDDEDRGSVQVTNGTEKLISTGALRLQISNDERVWTDAPASVVTTATITGAGIIDTFVAGANLSVRLVVQTAESDRKARVTWVIRRAASAVLATGEGVAR